MKTSATQINRIINREGFKAQAYRDGSDAAGNPKHSIGYGHQIGVNEANLLTAKINVSQALAMLHADIAPLEIQINRATETLKQPPNQNQFDAFEDFGYNCGSGALAKVLATYKSNPADTKAVTNEMAEYNKTHDNATNQLVVSSELAARRAAEISIFNSPFSPAVKTALSAVAVCAIVGGLYAFLS